MPSSEYAEILIKDEDYLKQAHNFFDYFIKFKEIDNSKRDRAEYLLLKKGIKFRE